MRPQLNPNTSHQTTRYEVETLINDKWVLDRTYDSLNKAVTRASLNNEERFKSRVVIVSETRRLR
jgi:hypothetical protein